MLLSSLLLIPTSVHAGTGVVSVNGGTQVISAGTDTTVSVPINIAGSDSLNGFDIQVVADPTILNGASVSLTGSVLTSSIRIVLECINGILVAGSTCAPQDANGVVHFSIATLGSPVAGTGLLFTINYNIIGHTATTPISFNTGCSGTSVSGVCVTIANAGVALSEIAQGSTFSNLNDFTIAAAFAKISTSSGVTITDTLSYAALGAFSDPLIETVTGPCTLVGSVDLTTARTGSNTLSCSSTTNNDFTSNVTATGLFSGVSHFTVVKIHVGPAGFASSLNHASVTLSAGSSDSTTIITLQGVTGFSGSITITATGPTGVTGSPSPSMVTLTPDASGYSTATSTLTVNVAGSVAAGLYSLVVTGGSTLTVNVPPRDFTVVSVPDHLQVPRGGAAVAIINLVSLGAFSGTVTFSATITPISLDAGTGVNNIVASFLPATVTLAAGGSVQTGFSGGTVKIGTSPNPANTATGDYVATINATSGSISHSSSVTFSVQDFTLGPTFCSGKSLVFTSPDAFFDPVAVGEQCNTFTLTTQTVAQGGAQSTLWMQVNSLGHLETHGASQTGVVAAVNPTGPGRGSRVPELHRNVCFFQTFFANGTQLSRSYIQANGPVVRAGPFSGCRFSFAYAIPNDVEAPTCVRPDNPSLLDCAVVNNVDFYAITADALKHTLPGTYLVNVCGSIGVLLNCQMITLIVVNAPVFNSLVWTNKNAISASLGGHFKLQITNVDPTFSIFAQVTLSGTGSFGDTFTVTAHSIAQTAPGGVTPYNIDVSFTAAEVGETFTFTSSILASAVDAGAVAVDPANGTSSAGTSTLAGITSTFTVGP